jgi:hypothetical protein
MTPAGQALSALGAPPLVVLTATGNEDDPAWLTAQERMAALSTNSDRYADSTLVTTTAAADPEPPTRPGGHD